MKITFHSFHSYKPNLKFILKMNIASLLLSLICLQVYALGWAQEITLSVNKAPLNEVLQELREQSDYAFFYKANYLQQAGPITLSVKNKPIEEVLPMVFKNQPFEYVIKDKTIIIKYQENGQAREMALTSAQQAKIAGVVTDGQGPLPGVSVLLKNTSRGTLSNTRGEFTLEATIGDTLVFRSIGYITQEVPINQPTVNVVLAKSDEKLDEVVVMGYGSLDKRLLTSAVSDIRPNEFIGGTPSPMLAIQGKVPGLSVQSTNGTDPNAGVSLQLRGINSVNASQGPLIVIDGVPGADLNAVAKEDIESINVLKDASAAAIYGTRASGGVILITTKKPVVGNAQVNLTSELFTETIRRRPDILSAQEFRDFGKTDDGTYDLGASTNWFDEVTNKNPFSQRYVVNAGGGTENARVMASFNTRKAKGMAVGSDRKEIGGRVNSYFKFLEGRLELSSNVSYSEINANLTDNAIFEKAMAMNPTLDPYDADDPTGYNVILGGLEYWNPLAEVKLRDNQLSSNFLLASSILKWNVTDFWSISGMAAAKRTSAYQVQYRSAEHRISRETGVNGWANQNYAKNMDKTFDLTTNLDKTFGIHAINAVLGYSFQEFNGQGFWAENQDFPVDGIGPNNLGSGSFLSEGRANMGSSKNTRTRLISFFGRVNYALKDRYLLTATLRHEGSSKFYDNKWGTFPGISAGWRISGEDFMKDVQFVNDLKLRAGYGETGNEGFSSTTAFRVYALDDWANVNGDWVRVYGLQHNQNKAMQWEVKKETDIGLDFTLFNNRLTGRLDWYRRKVNKLIYEIPVSSPPNVFATMVANAGDLENSGFEMEANWKAVQKKDFSYSTGLVASTNKSKITSLGADASIYLHSLPNPGSAGVAVRVTGDEPIGQFYIFKSAGFDEAGKPLIYNRNDEVIAYDNRSDLDKRFIGNAIPKLSLSWTNNFNYKNWDLSVYMRSWLGYDVFNVTNMYYGLNNSFSNGRNVLRSAYEKNAQIDYGSRILSDYWIEKGDFLKIDVVTLGYTFKSQKIKPLSNLRVYLTGRDLFTITGYSGLDPEVNVNGLDPGFEDVTAYPKTRTFMFGVQVSF